jgi:hypothetical protein
VRVHHRIIPQYLENVDIKNGNSVKVQGIQLEITTTTQHDDGPDTKKIEGYWMTLSEAAALSVAIDNLRP